MRRVVIHKNLGTITYIKKLKIKHIRAAISLSRGIVVSVPYFASYSVAQKFVEDNELKFLEFLQRQKENAINGKTINVRTEINSEQIELLREQAKLVLVPLTQELAKKMNESFTITDKQGRTVLFPFSYNSITIKDNTSNWGSCSRQRNLNLNMHLIKLPKELMSFVIIHELAHLVYLNHAKDFHGLVNSACNGMEKKFTTELKKYRLK